MTASIRINRDELRNRVLGCWTGKNIGGTLGGPYEGAQKALNIKGYVTPPGEPLPNDDLDLQLVWLKALQDRGPQRVDARVLGEYWLTYVTPHWNEYGVSKANQRLGLPPPSSGQQDNEWRHSNGAWIRSEIWACIAPGAPDIAATYAYEDACVDHGAGEGTHAELFTAALQSAAFVCSDPDQLLDIGLARIPAESRVARAVRLVRELHGSGATWEAAREAVLEETADLGWFQAPANVAFVVIGWLWGDGDIERSLFTAINCGDDTDCTGATLGALLGIIHGRSGLPDSLTEPIGDRILTVAIDRGSMIPPATIGALTDQCLELAPQTLAVNHAPVVITGGPTDLSSLNGQLLTSRLGPHVHETTGHRHRHDLVHTEVVVDHPGGIAVGPGEQTEVRLSFRTRLPERRDLDLEWILPEGWTVDAGARSRIRVESPTTSIHAVDAHIGKPPADWPPTTTATFRVRRPSQPGAPVERGIIRIVSPGRPTVGLIPLVFVCEAAGA